MSQGIPGIRHFRKCLGISGNAEAIEGFPVLPRQLWEFQAFLKMPRELGKFFIFFTNIKFFETAQQQKDQI